MNFKLDGKAEVALSHLQDTDLSPMEEALFQAWAKANQIKKPDAADDPTDYRGIYKMTKGKILPYGTMPKLAKKHTSVRTLEQVLRDKLLESQQSEEDKAMQFHKEERQDVTHQQKMEQKQMELAKAPHDLQMKDRDLEAKQMDLQKQDKGLVAQELGNQGKELDIQKAMIAPIAAPAGSGNASGQTGTSTSK